MKYALISQRQMIEIESAFETKRLFATVKDIEVIDKALKILHLLKFSDAVGIIGAELAKPEQEQEPESHIVKWSIPVDPNNFGEPLAQPEKEEPLPPVDIGVDVTPEGTHVVACYNRPDAVQEMFYSQFHPLTKPKQSKYSDIVSDGGLDPRNKFDAQPEQEAYGYAKRLAEFIWEKHYKKESPDWTPLPDVLGVLTQIDNMTCGLELAKPEMPTKIFGPNLEQILNAAGFYRREWVGLTDDEIKEVLDLNVAPWSLSGVALQHVMDDARALEAKLKEKNDG